MHQVKHFRLSQSFAAGLAASAIIVAGLLSTASAAPGPKEAGLWYDDKGDGAIKIEPCGDKLCGRIFWLKKLVNEKGEVLTDKHNPDESQRTRTICGLPILGQLAKMPEGGFDGGWVYDPKEGKSYSVAIELTGPDALSVTGYKGVRFLGKTFTWTRVKTELPGCATTQSSAPDGSKPKAAAGGSGASGAASGAAAATGAAKKAAAPAARNAEALPWADAKPTGAKPATTAPSAKANPAAAKLGAGDVKPALKKPQAPAQKPSADDLYSYSAAP